MGFLDCGGGSPGFIARKKMTLPIDQNYGLQRSGTWFETVRVENGIPFHLEDHVERFFSSAGILLLPAQWSPDYVYEKACAIAKINRALFPRSVLKIIGSAVTDDGFTLGKYSHLAIFQYPLKVIDASVYETGIALGVHHYTRPLPQAKFPSSGYEEARRFLHANPGFDEVLFCRPGRIGGRDVSECSTSNFFCISRGVVSTPSDDVALAGITRAVVLSLLKTHEIPTVVDTLSLADVYRAESAFITSTTRKILPVGRVHWYQYNVQHLLLRRLMRVFDEYEKEYFASRR